jgi:Uma2 family endonuclease
MTTVREPKKQPRRKVPALPPPSAQVTCYSGIDWPTYVAFSDSLDERRIRVTYADGEMEIMTVGRKHERGKKLLARFIEVLLDELELDAEGVGSMTLRREDLRRAIEPDECYWIQHESLMRAQEDYEPERDPPPDLGLEVDITRSSMNRMEIYAKLKVPEVWRWDGTTLGFVGLVRGRYGPITHSRAFPMLRPEDLQRFLQHDHTASQTSVVRAFRRWVRRQIANGWRQ